MIYSWRGLLRPETALKLEQQWLEQRPLKGTSSERDFKPVAKLFTVAGAATWLLSEKEPNGSLAFGLCDLGMGCPELGEVDLDELASLRMGGPAVSIPAVEEDLYWQADKSLSEYAEEARRLSYIKA